MTTNMDLITYTSQPPIQSAQLAAPSKRSVLSQTSTPLCQVSTSPQLSSTTSDSSTPSSAASLQQTPVPATTQSETYPSNVVPLLKPPEVAAASSSTMTMTLQKKMQSPHAKDRRPEQNDDVYSMSFKVWRSQHMTNTAADDHDNTPIDAPLPSTLLEKHVRKNLRAIQLEHYRTWSIKESRQRRQLQRQKQPQGGDDDGADRRLRVRFTLPTKFKRNGSTDWLHRSND